MNLYTIIYAGKNITKNITEILVSIDIVDRLEGKAGDLCIELADHEAKFAGEWYPETDDKIEVWIEEVYCGAFWVDEVTNHGDRSGTFCTIRAMSLKSKVITAGLHYKSYRGKALNVLAKEVADKMGLSIKGSITGNIVDNCTNKNDLQFLNEQARKLGYILKVDSGALVFSKYEDLKKQKSLVISKKDVITWSIKDKAIGRYSKCTCNWYDATKKISYTGSATKLPLGHAEANIWEEVSSNADAVSRAKDWLEDKLKQKAEIELELVGDKRLWAGVHIELKDFGKKNGSYIIKEPTHRIDRGGKYKTTIILQE